MSLVSRIPSNWLLKTCSHHRKAQLSHLADIRADAIMTRQVVGNRTFARYFQKTYGVINSSMRRV
jgi:hypothetical protein